MFEPVLVVEISAGILTWVVLLGAGFLTRRRENLDARRTARALGLPVRRRLLPPWGIALGWVLLSYATVLGTLWGREGTTAAGLSALSAAPPGRLLVGVIAAGFLLGGAHCWWQRRRIRAGTSWSAAKLCASLTPPPPAGSAAGDEFRPRGRSLACAPGRHGVHRGLGAALDEPTGDQAGTRRSVTVLSPGGSRRSAGRSTPRRSGPGPGVRWR